MGRRNFTHVDWRIGEDHSRTNTGEHTEDEVHRDIHRASLQSTGNNDDDGGGSIGDAPTEFVGQRRLREGTKKGTTEEATPLR